MANRFPTPLGLAAFPALVVSLLTLSGASSFGQALVVDQGHFTQDGQRYRGIGVNYYDAFLRSLRNDDNTYDAGFADLARHGVPFARFNAGGFFADDWQLYQTDKAEYFARLDAVVASAQTHGVQLIPSLFWNSEGVAEFNGETNNAWNDGNSATRQFARDYTAEVVARYKDDPTILMWEFGNEFNLQQDLPTGDSTGRDPADVFSSDGVRAALTEFGTIVRGLDPQRAITSGHSVERAQASQLREDNTFVRDTAAEFRAMTTDDHPDPLDTISVHAYHHGLLGVNNDQQQEPTRRFDPEFDADYGDVLAELVTVSQDTGKPVFFGEFGVRDSFDFDIPGDGQTIAETTTEDRLRYLLDELTEAEAEVAALWVYDRTLGGEADWNIYPSDDVPDNYADLTTAQQQAIDTAIARRVHLDLIGEYNVLWQTTIPEPTAGGVLGLALLGVLRRSR